MSDVGAVARSAAVLLALQGPACGRVEPGSADGIDAAGPRDLLDAGPRNGDDGRDAGGPDASGADSTAADTGASSPEDAATDVGSEDDDAGPIDAADDDADVEPSDAPAAIGIDAGGPCGCGNGSWSVDLGGGPSLVGSTDPVALTSPYVLNVHCTEDAPILTVDECADLVRLSACSGPGNEPPCLYMATLPNRFLLGHVLAADGSRWDVLDGSFGVAPVEAGAESLQGTYTGVLRSPEGGTGRLDGEFDVCARSILCPP